MSEAYPSSSESYSISGRRDAFCCHVSVGRMILLVFLSCLLLLGCWYCTTVPSITGRIAGWVGLAFFGACTAYMMWLIPRMEPTLVIDDAGIDYHRVPGGTVPWTDVLSADVREMKGQRFLCVELHDEAPYLARLRWHQRLLASANRGMGFPLLTIGFTGMDRTAGEALEAVTRFRPK
jgi:hypothetical protein